MPVTPWGQVRRQQPPPLPRSANDNAKVSRPAPPASMRVTKRVPVAQDSAEEREWQARMDAARAQAEDEEREWQAVMARARAKAQIDEEREWRQLIARAQEKARIDEEREWQARIALARAGKVVRMPPNLTVRNKAPTKLLPW